MSAAEADVYPNKCGECGGPVEQSVEAISVDLRGETISVEGVEHGRCTQCGEAYLDLDATEHLQQDAVRQLRESRGLLTPPQIRSLRDSLELSQAGLEKLLGTGPKTVVRWEKGTVFQSVTADKLMRLLIAKPELATLVSSSNPKTAKIMTHRTQARRAKTKAKAPTKQRRKAS
jgi:HTH-type transcriptional regulator/antitoxin MqsA